MTRKRLRVWIAVAVLAGLGLAAFVVSRKMCIRAWLDYRLVLHQCPEGKLRQVVTASAQGLRRGAEGNVTVAATAVYTVRGSENAEHVAVTSFDTTLALVDPAGKEIALAPVKDWVRDGDARRAVIKLPDVPDGDYLLRARVTSRVSDDAVDIKLPLYTPARIHVITDRPLYQPGDVIHFRAVVLRARDLAPLDGRPGVWVVQGPSGETLLEEKAPAGDWGVVAGSFPLDKEAETGTWKVRWVSADASAEVDVSVEPFTLPRFRVEAVAEKPFYRPGESPRVNGQVIYSSGAPVTAAAVDVTWQVDSDWPPPTDWLKNAVHAVAGPNGRFVLELPQIPADLDRPVTLVGRISAVDAAGDRVEGSVAVLLGRDAIGATAVTELEGGLVPEFNNRLYLRVTTADGRLLPGAKITVKRAWEPADQGTDATLDEDGVASLQIDPGAPVNVVIPPLPYRAPPPPIVVHRQRADDLVNGQPATLDDQTAVDSWTADLAPCARWVVGGDVAAILALRVDAAGNIMTASAGPSPLEVCALGAIRAKKLPAGGERVLALRFLFSDPRTPSIVAAPIAALDAPAGFNEAVAQATGEARGCATATSKIVAGPLPKELFFHAHAGAKDVELSWLRDPAGIDSPLMACLEPRLTKLVLAKPATADGFGVVRFNVALADADEEAAHPQATVVQGYELLVTAHIDGEPTTHLIMTPGAVPPLRLRATPVLAKAGDTVSVEALRGPGYDAALPVDVTLDHLKGHLATKLDPDTHQASFTLPADVSGWCEIRAGGARALVFVRPESDLIVAVTPRAATYKPGELAQLDLSTTVGGHGTAAAVGLIGVDSSLGQLVPLPGAGDLARLRPQVGTSSPAFGVLDGQALTLGRVRGANAAAATVVRVTTIPPPPALDAEVSASAQTALDPVAELTDRFYNVLAELHTQTRKWEASAAAGEKMHPAMMAKLWDQALAACAARGERTDDAYGRRLRLSRLPADLLALTDPRAVVLVGTRLPEDVENWAAYVAKERP